MYIYEVYRDEFFDSIIKKLDFGNFTVFRDRQITKSNSEISPMKAGSKMIRVLKSRNICADGTIKDIHGYDSYIELEQLKKLAVYKFFKDKNIFLVPNMTYNPRMIRNDCTFTVNGSVAILIPKDNVSVTENQMKYFSSDEFKKFYRIARNYQTRSLNIDAASVFFFGLLHEEI